LADFIQAERRVELAGEGFRFFDLVRTGKALQEIPNFKAGKMSYFQFRLRKFNLRTEIGHKIWILKINRITI
jgi:hypothetical protein